MATIAQLPEGTKNYLTQLIKEAIDVFRSAEESELLAWGERIHTDFATPYVQNVLAIALDEWKYELDDGSTAGSATRDGDPVAYTQLVHETQALFDRDPRRTRDANEPDVLDHSFDLGEVALESLKEALNSSPHAQALISIIKELVQLAKSVNRRLKAGW